MSEVKVPISLIMDLAGSLQFSIDKNYGELLDSKQMREAERLIREYVALLNSEK